MTQDSAYTIRMNATLRTSTLADLETHVVHRTAMFKDMEMGSEEGLKRMAEAFRTQLRNWLVTGQCRGLLVEDGGKAVASVLLLMKESVPTPVTPLSVRGYLFNVYTLPSHRRKGLAARLTDAALDLARDLGLEIVELHASLEAEGLYQRMGFVPTSEMRLVMGAGIKTPKQWKHRRA
jgi:GNAT superfamily N-acetyltransferase